MKLKFTIFILSFFYLLTLGHSIKAQNDLEDQINKIGGNVDKITISADGQEYTFEGKDAEKLFKKMKSTKSKSFVWNTSNDSKNKKVIILDSDSDEDAIEIEIGDENVFIIKTGKDLDDVDEGMSKKVKVEIENGNKKVTVTTNENGEETTEVYEGDEADEYLENMKSDNDDLDIIIEKDNGKKVKKIIIETEKEVN